VTNFRKQTANSRLAPTCTANDLSKGADMLRYGFAVPPFRFSEPDEVIMKYQYLNGKTVAA